MAIIGIAIAGSFGLSLVLGPVIAAGYGIEGIFNLTGILGVIGIGLLLWVIPSPTTITTNLDASVVQSKLIGVLRDAGLWRVNLSVFCLHYLLVSGFSIFPLLFEGTEVIERDQHALYYLGLLAGSFVLMLPFMWLADRLPSIRPILILMVAISLAAFGLLYLNQTYWWLLIGMGFFFMAFNLLETVLPAQLSKIAKAGERGTSMGVYTTCQFLGIFAGGVVSGWLLENYSISQVLMMDMGLIAFWLLVSFSFPRLGQVSSRTISLGEMTAPSANERVEALLSVHGVLDVVIIDADKVAYLKVDEQQLDEETLKQVAGLTAEN